MSTHKGNLVHLRDGIVFNIERERPRQFLVQRIPFEDRWVCDACAKWWPTDRDPDDAESTCDPVCSHCEQPAEAHQDGKCLFGPGRYEMARYVITV